MQKTTNFGGRKWIAWFTQDIPISKVPINLEGLPGLILKIEDDKHNFIYTFSRNKIFPKPLILKKFCRESL